MTRAGMDWNRSYGIELYNLTADLGENNQIIEVLMSIDYKSTIRRAHAAIGLAMSCA